MIMAMRFGFEARTADGRWSAEAAGQQDASDTFATRSEAEAELPALAMSLACLPGDVRVVGMHVKSRDEEKAAKLDKIGRSAVASIVEHVRALEKAEKAEDADAYEKAEQEIQEAPLSVEVRGGWHTPGDTRDADRPEEYRILLATGGPAVRIIGELDNDGEPFSATLQTQDWGTSWTDYRASDAEEKALLRYAQCFYFGEG